MLPNILCNCICHCIALWLVNEWKIPSIASNMQLSMWLYMPHEVFLQLIVFCHLSKQLQSLLSHVFIMTKLLNFTIKILVIYFQISFCDRRYWKTTSETEIKNEITKLNIEYFDHVSRMVTFTYRHAKFFKCEMFYDNLWVVGLLTCELVATIRRPISP